MSIEDVCTVPTYVLCTNLEGVSLGIPHDIFSVHI